MVVSTLIFHHLPTEVKHLALTEIHRVLAPKGRFLLADFGKPEGVYSRMFFGAVRALSLPELRTMRDNIEGRIPDFLRAAGFRVVIVAPRYRGVQFLLATKQTEAYQAHRVRSAEG